MKMGNYSEVFNMEGVRQTVKSEETVQPIPPPPSRLHDQVGRAGALRMFADRLAN